LEDRGGKALAGSSEHGDDGSCKDRSELEYISIRGVGNRTYQREEGTTRVVACRPEPEGAERRDQTSKIGFANELNLP